jgi:hypothetical protein
MTTGRLLHGVERDRAIIRGAALRIIRMIEDFPSWKGEKSRRDWLAPPPLSAFRRMEPLGFGLNDDDWWIFDPKECTPDIVWPLDVSIACDVTGDLTISRTRTVTAKEVRGVIGRFGPFMVRRDGAQLEQGKMMTFAGVWVWMGGKWCYADNRRTWGKNGNLDHVWVPAERDTWQPMLGTAVALRQRYEWAVALGLEDSPSVRFVTDPTGMKEVFRIRDLPEGRDRRSALMTWVSDHWRQDRHDPDIERYVRSHLRGAVSFSWRGMEGEIIPSQFDLEKRDQFIAEREAMRAAGIDKRLTRPDTKEHDHP